jgi:hypothetical protein
MQPSSHDPNDPLLLLHILAVLVERDGVPVGFEADVAIGVDTAHGPRWLHARLGRVCATEIVEHEPRADAILQLGEREAVALMSGESLPQGARVSVRGAVQAVTRFIERYIGHQSWLAAAQAN